MIKKIFFAFLLLINFTGKIWACAACEEQQPAFLKGITHGPGPDSNLDYFIVSIAMIIVLTTLYYSVKWLIKPGETNANHIKQTIFNKDDF